MINRTARVYFVDGPKKGMIEATQYAGMPICVQVVKSPSPSIVVSLDTPIDFDESLKITRYMYYPISRYRDATGGEIWKYSLDASSNSKPSAPPKKYKVVRRPKMLKADNGKA